MDGEEIIGVYGTKGPDYFYSMGFIVWKPPKQRPKAVPALAVAVAEVEAEVEDAFPDMLGLFGGDY